MRKKSSSGISSSGSFDFVGSLSFDEDTFLALSPRKVTDEGAVMQLFSPKLGDFVTVSTN